MGREKEVSPSVDSFTKQMQQPGLCQVKARSQELHPGLPSRQKGLKLCGHPLLLVNQRYPVSTVAPMQTPNHCFPQDCWTAAPVTLDVMVCSFSVSGSCSLFQPQAVEAKGDVPVHHCTVHASHGVSLLSVLFPSQMSLKLPSRTALPLSLLH